MNYINLVIASKQPMPQWLAPDEAYAHCKTGASIWRWASSDAGDDPDMMLAAGNNMTLEMLAAVSLLRREVPELRLRVVNVTDLMVLGLHTEHPHGLTEEAFEALFTADRPVIFNFHGYPNAVQALLFERPNVRRFTINGYREEGTTTTPLDMHIRNGTSRYHLVMQALQAVPRLDSRRTQQILAAYRQKLADHRRYIEQYGEDPTQVRDWSWA